MADLVRYLRLSLKVLARRPGFTLLLVVTLGLGVGGSTAVFTVLNTVALRPLPYPDPERLVSVWETHQLKGASHERLSAVNFNDYRDLDRAFEGMTAWWQPQLNLTDEYGEPTRVKITDVTDNFFSVMGVQPNPGRAFSLGEDRAGADPVLIISHELWQERYGSDLAVLGRSISLDERAFMVVGVAPPGFGFPGGTSIWRPLGWNLSQHSRAAHFMEGVARLTPGTTLERAQEELTSLTRRLEEEYPRTNAGWGARIVPLQEEMVGTLRPALWLLLASTGVFLLIGCANIANMLLIQTASREREVAIRTAIGASRRQLWLQFATESFVQALLGGLVGIFVAGATIKWFVLADPFDIPGLNQVAIDGSVLGFATMIVLITGVLFGIVPSLKAPRIQVSEALKDGAHGGTAGSASQRARKLLVISEISLATMLTAAACLLIQSFLHLVKEEHGIDPQNVLTANIQLPVAKYDSWEKVELFYRHLLENIETKEVVSFAEATNYLPLDAAWQMPLAIAGRAAGRTDEQLTAQFRIVSPHYFRAIGIEILQGRSFERWDDSRSAPAVVINQEAAKRFWNDSDPVGETITTPITSFGPLGHSLLETSSYEVIGVARDAKNNTLLNAAEPTVYFTFHQFPYRSMYLIIKGKVSSQGLLEVVREEIRRLDRFLALANVHSMEQNLSRSIADRRFSMLLVAIFAFLSLLLAFIGIYGVLAYAVTCRHHEIGVRMSLGARKSDILALMGREASGLTLTGLLLGVFGYLTLARFIASFLYGVAPNDWVTVVVVTSVVLVGAVLAFWLPARRAADTNPATTIRVE